MNVADIKSKQSQGAQDNAYEKGVYDRKYSQRREGGPVEYELIEEHKYEEQTAKADDKNSQISGNPQRKERKTRNTYHRKPDEFYVVIARVTINSFGCIELDIHLLESHPVHQAS